jgi:hypothetical protein
VRAVLAESPSFEGQKVVYGAGCLLGRNRLQAHVGVVKVPDGRLEKSFHGVIV